MPTHYVVGHGQYNSADPSIVVAPQRAELLRFYAAPDTLSDKNVSLTLATLDALGHRIDAISAEGVMPNYVMTSPEADSLAAYYALIDDASRIIAIGSHVSSPIRMCHADGTGCATGFHD
ncbi:hypothetical protein, partial [Streptomyces sp. WAC02707]|uniref:hypothetical protein n=1 Tax=Streptomyces sp. WAC02707 TaxID=2487417 RepID=UPI001C8CFD2C